MSFISIPKELIEELEWFRKSFGDKWLSISMSQRVFRTQRVPFADRREPVEIGRQKAQILNNLASIFNKYWKDFVKVAYGEKINLYNILQDMIGDEAKNEARAVEQWFRGLITSQQFAEYIAQKLQQRLEKEIEIATGRSKTVQVKVISDLKDLFSA
jgi:hypothetical protein